MLSTTNGNSNKGIKRKREESSTGANDDPEGLDRRQLKKLKKKRSLTREEYFKLHGEYPRLVVENTLSEALQKGQTQLHIWDFQGFLLHAFDSAEPPKFLKYNRQLMKKLVIIQVEGLTRESCVNGELQGWDHQVYPLKLTTSQFDKHGVLQRLLHISASKIKGYKKPKDTRPDGLGWKASDFVLTPKQLAANMYPCIDTAGFVDTATFTPKEDHKLVGVDCEMVETKEGLELARTSLVDENNKLFYDALCSPTNPIINYNTKYSGITKEQLDGIERRVGDIQKDISEFVSKDTILVGHSLECDLRALKIIHLRCCDSAILYPHSCGDPRKKSSLKYLAKKHLKENIQQGDKGHDSREDAITALKLLKLKMRYGPNFGVHEGKEHFFKLMERLKKKGAFIANRRTLQEIRELEASTEYVHCESDEEVCRKAIDRLSVADTNFVWLVLDGLNRGGAIEDLNGILTRFWNNLSDDTLVVTLSGDRNVARLKELNQMRILSRNESKPFEHEAEFKALQKASTRHFFTVAGKSAPVNKS